MERSELLRLPNEEKVSLLIEGMMDGRTIRSLVKELFVDHNTFNAVISGDRELAFRYNQAMVNRADILADEIIDIADNEPDPNKGRLRTDVRKWYASKLMPSRYGDRMEVNLQGSISITEALDEARGRLIAPIIDVLPEPQPQQTLKTEPSIFD